MNTTARGDGPQWVCFGCNRPTLVISARVVGSSGAWPMCPTCEIRHGASDEFRSKIEKRVKAADLKATAAMVGITPQQITDIALACGPDFDKFKARLAGLIA